MCIVQLSADATTNAAPKEEATPVTAAEPEAAPAKAADAADDWEDWEDHVEDVTKKLAETNIEATKAKAEEETLVAPQAVAPAAPVQQKVHFTPSPLHPFTPHPFTPSPLHPFTPSPLHPFTPSPLHPFTPSPLHPFTPSPLHPFTPSPLHPSSVCRAAPLIHLSYFAEGGCERKG